MYVTILVSYSTAQLMYNSISTDADRGHHQQQWFKHPVQTSQTSTGYTGLVLLRRMCPPYSFLTDLAVSEMINHRPAMIRLH